MSNLEKASVVRSDRITRTVLAPALLASGLVGLWMVANDGWLRVVAPSHAYGLLAFVAIDILLALVVMMVPRIAYLGALLISMTQVAAMAGDALTFTPAGALQAAFRAYLLGDTAFVALLGIQLAIVGITITAIAMPHGTRHRIHVAQATHLTSVP